MYEKLLLEKFPFFADLPEAERKGVLESILYRDIKAGSVVMSQEVQCSGISLVLEGQFRVYKLSDKGKEIMLYHIRSGEACVLSAACLLGGKGDIAPVTVAADWDSKVAVLPTGLFRRLYLSNSGVQQFIFRGITDKFYAVMDLVEGISFKSVRDRLCEYLKSFSDNGNKPIYITHAQLASELGTAREVISRHLEELETDGRIRLARGKITFVK